MLIELGFATSAWSGAGPPLVTDDPGTLGDGNWEINIASTHERRAGEDLTELPLIDINYGVGERLQLKYEAAWLVLHEKGEGQRSGLSNSEIGVKWRFFDAGDGGLSISTYPQVEFNNPGSASDHRGLAEHGTTWILPVQLQQTLHGIDWNLEIGRVFHEGDDDWLYGFAASREFGSRVELAAELYGEATSGFGRSSLLANVGARLKLSDRMTLLVALGHELHNHFESPAQLQAYCALQLVL
jgi:hypothetical protein